MRHGMFTNDELQMKNVRILVKLKLHEKKKKKQCFSRIVYPAIVYSKRKKENMYMAFFFYIVNVCLIKSPLLKTINVLSMFFQPNRFKSLSLQPRQCTTIRWSVRDRGRLI